MHPFVEQAVDYAEKFPLLAPANFNFAEFQKDWKLTMQVKSILKDEEERLLNELKKTGSENKETVSA